MHQASLSVLLLAVGAHAGYVLGPDPPATTCSGHFNTACGNYIINSIVTDVSAAIVAATTSADLGAVFDSVTAGSYNKPINFWPFVVDAADGKMVAYGRMNTLTPGVTSAYDGASFVGKTFAEVALDESGVVQNDALSYIMNADTTNDGYFEYVGWDNYHTLPSGVPRVGVVRKVLNNATGRALLVAAAFSNRPLMDTTTEQPCSNKYSELCSFAYTRRMIGEVTTAFLKVRSKDAFEGQLAKLTNREFNKDKGFYPFMYSYGCPGDCEGMCVAHGVNPKNPGRTLMGIIQGAAALRDHVNGTELHYSFVEAAEKGGGFVGYMWYNPGEGVAYLKVAYITGVERFGVKYYIGVGFNHDKRPAKSGPHCTPCNQNFNYPCSWANVLALLGHCQSLLAMVNRYTDAQAFDYLTGGGKDGGGEYKTDFGFYSFTYDYNGTAVAHGWVPSLVGRNLTDIVAGFSGGALLRTPFGLAGWTGWTLHTDFVREAKAGGGWVRYPWYSEARGVFDKLAYVVQITRGGRDYYVGVGMADLDWGEEFDGGQCARCGSTWNAGCPEHCGTSVAGRLLADLFTATTHETLFQKRSILHVRPGAFTLPTPTAGGGYSAHLHSRTTVLVDSDPSLIGTAPAEWFANVGLPSNFLDGKDFTGTWLGPAMMRRNGTMNENLLFYCAVEISDTLADSKLDGQYDTYYLLVEVPTSMADRRMGNTTTSCADQVVCADSRGNTNNKTDCAKPLIGRPGLCTCTDDYMPYYIGPGHDPDALTCPTGAEVAIRGHYGMRCMMDPVREEIYAAQAEAAELAKKEEEAQERTKMILIIVGIIGAVIFLFALYRVATFFKKAIKLKQKEEERKLKRCHQAIKSAITLQSSAYLVSFKDFQSMGKLIMHEQARIQGMLKAIDEYEELIDFATKHPVIFFSHQWLSWADPDPDKIQYNEMIKSCSELCRTKDYDPTDTYIFLDILSIPQRNLRQRQCAIETLGCFASIFEHFVVVAPDVVHKDTKKQCNKASYARRGWCRLEQWGHMCVSGTNGMYFYNGKNNKLEPLDDTPADGGKDWFLDSIMVIDGDYTNPASKAELVDTILGLYAMVLNGKEGTTKVLHDLIRANYSRVFPAQYFEDLPNMLNTLVSKENSSHKWNKQASSADKQAIDDLRRSGASLSKRIGKVTPYSSGVSVS